MSSTWKKSIIRDLSITEEELDRVIARAPHSYKTYTIPKKSGGVRRISQPAQEVKYLQYWLIRNVFSSLPVHPAATAYESGSSIRRNAAAHQSSRYLVKFDFRNFFTSIKHSDVQSHLMMQDHAEMSLEDAHEIARLACIKYPYAEQMCLSIGAPSSPKLSNSILFRFDEVISEWCSENGFTYSRYADDMTFSTNQKGLSDQVEGELRSTIRSLQYPELRLNNRKTMHLSKASSRRITGIVLTNQGPLSIGRAKKRQIRSMVYAFKQGGLEESDVWKLQGLIGFAMDVEKNFIPRLKEKYGSQVIDEILRLRKPDVDGE